MVLLCGEIRLCLGHPERASVNRGVIPPQSGIINSSNKIMNRPRITYKKWWHRFVPSYRRRISLMDYMFEEHWKHGGEEEHRKHMKEFVLTGETRIGDKAFYFAEF